MTQNDVIIGQKSLLPVNQLAISRVTGDFRINEIDIRYQRDESFLTSYCSTKSEKVEFFTKSARRGQLWCFLTENFQFSVLSQNFSSIDE